MAINTTIIVPKKKFKKYSFLFFKKRQPLAINLKKIQMFLLENKQILDKKLCKL